VLRDTLSQIWVNQRLPNGAFANPFPPDLAAGHAGFNPAMLLYGIERSGERRRRFDWLASIAPSWPYTVPVDRATAFDALGVAYAYTRLGLPESIREVLAQWLRGYSIPALGGLCIRRPNCYGNLKLVDALAVLAMTNTSLRSNLPKARLANPVISRAYARSVINELIPRVSDHRLRATFADGHKEHGSLLSDPPVNPLAYHTLSTWMLGQALIQLGPEAAPAAWQVYRENLTALSVLVAPDGTVTHMGRGQDQVWTLAMVVGAMTDGAALYAATEPARASEYLAVAERALTRLQQQHLYAGGVRIVSGPRTTVAGIDPYAHWVAYNGLTLFVLTLAAERAVTLPRALAVAPGIPADAPLRVIDPKASRMAWVRSGPIWLAVHARRSDGHDLRYDFGLLALKRFDGTQWQNLLAPRPLTHGRKPQSMGPSWIVGSRLALPEGKRMRLRRSGRVTVFGGYRLGSHVRRRVRFRFTPTATGARLGVRGLHPRDHLMLRLFTPAGSGRRVSATVVRANNTLVKFPAHVHVVRMRGYHSGPVERLDALCVTWRAGRRSSVVIGWPTLGPAGVRPRTGAVRELESTLGSGLR
jgi:hypothetical protein